MSDAVYEIFPAIGIARVGNAPAEFYIGPERSGGLPTLPDDPARPFGPDDFRDSEGRLRRQAARFRIFRHATGMAQEEITLDTADVVEIRWTVHLANKKASWYRFLTLQGEHGYGPNHPLRNAERHSIEDRRQLVIDPGPRDIAGRSAGGASAPIEFSRATIPARYKGGSFPPPALKPHAIETLGALRTDGSGRLLVLGGFGHSGTLKEPPALTDYANNDGWWDDISDGSVRAVIRLRSGETVEAKPAWVLVAPPAYAPQLRNLITLYDTMFDTAVRHLGARPDILENALWKTGPSGYRPRFETDIKPIFESVAMYPWVSAIPADPHRFDDGKLSDPGPAGAGLRQFLLNIMRGPGQQNMFDSEIPGVSLMPHLTGDDAIRAEQDAGALLATGKYLPLTDTQYFFLQQWAAGHFDQGGAPEPDAGQALTRAVLENCVGGALAPGIEMTWIARDPAIYLEPFRIRPRSPTPDPLSLGADRDAGVEPGDLTCRMALPWQADLNECSTQKIQGRAMWWWPAQRPASVYLSPERTTDEAAAGGLGPQVPWIGSDNDPTAKDYLQFADNMEMLRNWDRLGFVFDLGAPDKPSFVEVARTLPRTPQKKE